MLHRFTISLFFVSITIGCGQGQFFGSNLSNGQGTTSRNIQSEQIAVGAGQATGGCEILEAEVGKERNSPAPDSQWVEFEGYLSNAMIATFNPATDQVESVVNNLYYVVPSGMTNRTGQAPQFATFEFYPRDNGAFEFAAVADNLNQATILTITLRVNGIECTSEVIPNIEVPTY